MRNLLFSHYILHPGPKQTDLFGPGLYPRAWVGENHSKEWQKLERKTNHEKLLTLRNKQRVAEGEVGGERGDW